MQIRKLSNRAFTVLELLLFIIVIGIVAASAYSRIEKEKQSTRNKEREGDLKSLQQSVEAYYAKNGTYPKASDVANPEWVTTNFKGLDANALKDPKGPNLNQDNGYQYKPTKDDGTSPCTDANDKCLKYTLSSNLENKPKLELHNF